MLWVAKYKASTMNAAPIMRIARFWRSSGAPASSQSTTVDALAAAIGWDF